MIYAAILLGLFLWFGFWSGQAGYSLKFFDNKLQSWQQKIPLGNRIPEFIIGLTFGLIATYGWHKVFGFGEWWIAPIVLLITSFISLVGKESATVFYLPHNWRVGIWKDSNGDGVVDVNDMRKSSMRVVNDFFAKILGVDIMSHWYAKIWAFTKGLLISTPIGLLCAIPHPICREISITLGEKLNKKYGHDVNSYAETVGDGLSYAIGCTIFIALTFGIAV